MKKKISTDRVVFLGLLVLITLSGCSESQKSQPAADVSPSQTAEVIAESPKEAEPPAVSEQETRVQKQLQFATGYIATAKQGVTPYAQPVAICRDVIKNNPGTKYADQARELLRQVPPDQRARFNITDEELGL